MLTSVDNLTHESEYLFAQAPFLLGRGWLRCITKAALPAGAQPRFVLCRVAGRPVALVPLLKTAEGLSSFSTPYTITWQPLVAQDADASTLVRAGQALGRACRQWPVLHLDAMDPAWPGLPPLLAGLRRSGYHAAPFEHFGNWHEVVEGRDWDGYLAARPGALRETIRRKQAKIDRDDNLRFARMHSCAEVEAGIAAYRDVYRRSWKQPEPFPSFDAALLREAATAGALRLGLLLRDGVPVAAQYWIVSHGTATMLKLAHDQAFSSLSAGTVLTAWMIRRLMAEDGIQALDFGRGDDPYKQLWTTRRRRRIGFVLADALHPRGVAALARQWAGAALRQVRRRPLTVGSLQVAA